MHLTRAAFYNYIYTYLARVWLRSRQHDKMESHPAQENTPHMVIDSSGSTQNVHQNAESSPANISMWPSRRIVVPKYLQK
jgi:hypothetical protein